MQSTVSSCELCSIRQRLVKTESFFEKKKIIRVLPKNQIHWDKWPTEFGKGGPFQKIWAPSELPIYNANGISAFRQLKKT